MIWFKGCPRCSGDLYHDHDQYGQFVTCVQCGFCKDAPQANAGPLKITADPVPAPSVPDRQDGKRRRLSHGGRHFDRKLSAASGSAVKTDS